ncbi:hypothetical protein IWQ62_003732 [Dispira parvispora]|uniref:Eukaryotic membrane protein family-domain-containing protein n=1 Tax=Dispira parvispora TaxID=1520584 RepID=A0A9W8AU99_9FUNG|nr:hypothetical protein IWQ62_003732 [Dispira parvispora]
MGTEDSQNTPHHEPANRDPTLVTSTELPDTMASRDRSVTPEASVGETLDNDSLCVPMADRKMEADVADLDTLAERVVPDVTQRAEYVSAHNLFSLESSSSLRQRKHSQATPVTSDVDERDSDVEAMDEDVATVPQALQEEGTLEASSASEQPPDQALSSTPGDARDRKQLQSPTLPCEDSKESTDSVKPTSVSPKLDTSVKSASSADWTDSHADENPMTPNRPPESSTKTPPSSNTDPASDSALYSLWDHIQAELESTEYENTMAVQQERVSNFLQIPRQVEKLMFFGLVISLDSFLHTFTILPARIALAIWAVLKRPFLPLHHVIRQRRVWLTPSQRCDLMKGFLIAVCCIMLQSFDSAQLYHMVRGQSTVKVYVIFNMLEVFDRLCAAFGRDILDTLLSEISFYPQQWGRSRQEQWTRTGYILLHTVVAIVYMFIHAMIQFYYMVTLNVTINSYDYSLLTLLLSNQFAEIKSNVFKRYEKENLFQICCSDIVERFQIGVSLTIITLKNWIELSTGTGNADYAFADITLPFSFTPVPLPWSWSWQPLLTWSWFVVRFILFDWWFNLLLVVIESSTVQHLLGYSVIPSRINATAGRLTNSTAGLASYGATLGNVFSISNAHTILTRVLTPAILVYCSEMLADWTKHAFITKFNTVRPEIYGRYMDILCRDLVGIEPDTSVRRTPSTTTTPTTRNSSAGSTTPTNETSHSTGSHPTSARRKIRVERSLAVGNRIGLATLPLACLVIRNAIHILQMLFSSDGDGTHMDTDQLDGLGSWWYASALWSTVVESGLWILSGLMAFACLVFLKLLLGINLVQYAWQRYEGLSDRQREVEEKTRLSISRMASEQEWAKLQDDVKEPVADLEKKERLATVNLDNIDRYTLFKNRIP